MRWDLSQGQYSDTDDDDSGNVNEESCKNQGVELDDLRILISKRNEKIEQERIRKQTTLKEKVTALLELKDMHQSISGRNVIRFQFRNYLIHLNTSGEVTSPFAYFNYLSTSAITYNGLDSKEAMDFLDIIDGNKKEFFAAYKDQLLKEDWFTKDVKDILAEDEYESKNLKTEFIPEIVSHDIDIRPVLNAINLILLLIVVVGVVWFLCDYMKWN